MNEFMKKFESCEILSAKDFDELKEYCSYGSMGMLNSVVECLRVIGKRIGDGDKIYYYMSDGSRERLTLKSFATIVDKFPDYVVNRSIDYTDSKDDAYFNLRNTDEGLDLIYMNSEESQLFMGIANVSKDYALVYLRFNNVVYIRNRKTMDVTPMVSEHNNHYVYDINTGQIKEVM